MQTKITIFSTKSNELILKRTSIPNLNKLKDLSVLGESGFSEKYMNFVPCLLFLSEMYMYIDVQQRNVRTCTVHVHVRTTYV